MASPSMHPDAIDVDANQNAAEQAGHSLVAMGNDGHDTTLVSQSARKRSGCRIPT